MNCPRLPNIPANRVSQIEPSWFQRLNDCLQFAMTHPRGDGKTILQDAGGSLRAIGSNEGDGNGQSVADSGPFAVEIFNEGTAGSPRWRIRLYNSQSDSGIAGLLTIGSYREEIEDQEWEAQEGVVYLEVTYDPDTEEYQVVFDIESGIPETEEERRYILRIAEITYDEETDMYTAHQIRRCGDIEILGRWVQ